MTQFIYFFLHDNKLLLQLKNNTIIVLFLFYIFLFFKYKDPTNKMINVNGFIINPVLGNTVDVSSSETIISSSVPNVPSAPGRIVSVVPVLGFVTSKLPSSFPGTFTIKSSSVPNKPSSPGKIVSTVPSGLVTVIVPFGLSFPVTIESSALPGLLSAPGNTVLFGSTKLPSGLI